MFKKIILFLFLGLIVFILGFGTAIFLNRNIEEKGFQAGWKAAEKRLEETNFILPEREQQEIKSIFGEIIEVQGNKVYLKTTPLSPLADPNLDLRIIEVDNQTVIYQLVTKTREQIEKEGGSDGSVVMPGASKWYNKRKIELSQLKTGYKLTVWSEDNVRDKKQFLAKEMFIEPINN